jgi:hypothetical protein
MEAMLGISLYSCPYLNKQKCYVFLIIAYVFSSTKLENRAEQVPGLVVDVYSPNYRQEVEDHGSRPAQKK